MGIEAERKSYSPFCWETVRRTTRQIRCFLFRRSDEKHIYLTFDNGYENGYTAQILDVLKRKNVPATFFVTGHYLQSAPDLVQRMVNEGHIVGNHSWHHPDLTTVSDEKLREELEMVRKKTELLTGQEHMRYMRPPRGIFDERTMRIARELGYYHVFLVVSVRRLARSRSKRMGIRLQSRHETNSSRCHYIAAYSIKRQCRCAC
ncbi:Peptidoglycan-N-acetylmuramic acid deacetylase PdaA precursor [Anoxybacillus sp. BCO1]|nr:Peptidoglycan-N-acetylmuramic acid deacetylase PdaA precursor [Anoxybacillus sp. BCO1]